MSETILLTLSQTLRAAFPEPAPEVEAYLEAYERRAREGNAALPIVTRAWLALSEDQRDAIGSILDRR